MVILFEDEGYRPFLPLSHTRAVFDMRCGFYTMRERVAAFTGQLPTAICRPHLAVVYGAGRWPLELLSSSDARYFVNGRALDIDWLGQLRDEPMNTVYIADAGPGVLNDAILLGAKLSPPLASAIFDDLLHQRSQAALEELRRFARVLEVPVRLLTFPWDLIALNGEQIVRDMALVRQTLDWPSAEEHPPEGPGLVIRNPSQVFISPHARLDGPLVLDARDGPILVDAAHIEPFSFVQGPCALGAGALIASARIRAETSIGPICRIGGEVEASIVQGYSNKHHDGFLGHSYLGEWVNIGAMTTNSDLKNTYGSIKVVLEELGQMDSGQIKLGCFLADHVKLGIGVHLNGGAVIGTGSNIFGVHFAPKTIPSFTWGSDVFREYQIDRMISVSRKVMSRRKIQLTSAIEQMLRDVFSQTRGSRADIEAPPTALQVAELARAERDAVVSS